MSILKGLTIIFADDEVSAMRSTIDALEVHGATVIKAVDGTELLTALKPPPADRVLAIIDIMMAEGPDIRTPDEGRSTGLSAYRTIREELKLKIPIVISTVVTDPELLAAFNSDRRVSIIRKPYYFDELYRKIEKVIA